MKTFLIKMKKVGEDILTWMGEHSDLICAVLGLCTYVLTQMTKSI